LNKKTKSVVQFIVLLSIGIVLVWLSFKSVWTEKDRILESFKSANYFWIFISMLISFFSHFLRAYRWNYLLKPTGHSLNIGNSLGSVLVGYFANYGLPRMGEITRCTLVTKYNKVPFEIALGTVITERIVDMFLLIIIFFLTLFAQFRQLKDLTAEYIYQPLLNKFGNFSSNPAKLAILIGALVIVIGGFYFFRKKFSNVFKGKLGNIIKGFAKGLSSVKDVEGKFQFILLSMAIWVSYFYGLYVCFFAFEGTSHLGQSECLVLLLFGTIGVIFTPGGLGVYPALISSLLIYTYHVDQVTAFAFPWMTWTSQFVLIVVSGLISLLVLPIINKSKRQ
jgi:uncharacterized protein (TIRG00374 family)